MSLRVRSTPLVLTLLVTIGCHKATAPQASPPDAGWPSDGTLPSHSTSLPFDYQRPDVGTPVSAADLATETDHFLQLLQNTRYFRFVDDRVHGWPESDPAGHYWYGTWWSGITVTKKNGKVTYLHASDGADNNGLRTAPLLEGACYAYELWKTPAEQHLVRKLMRGFTSWFMAMERMPNDPDTLLARAAYPAPVESNDNGHQLYIDTSLNRPGVDGETAVYVHIPNNPYWGDLWLRNQRSKDDIGDMLRAVAQLDNCAGLFTDDAAKAELKELRRRFEAWSKRVEEDNWGIATLDKNLNVGVPDAGLAQFATVGGLECGAQLAIRLNGHGDPGDLDCGDGTVVDEGLDIIQASAIQIVRSFHEAAVQDALLANQQDVAQQLLGGLGHRLDVLFDRVDAGSQPTNTSNADLSELVIQAANTGVPLTSREVRFLHARIEEAYASYGTPDQQANDDLFNPSTPDGTYSYDPPETGLDFKDIGVLLGTCVAQYRNPHSQPVLDCERVRAWLGEQQ